MFVGLFPQLTQKLNDPAGFRPMLYQKILAGAWDIRRVLKGKVLNNYDHRFSQVFQAPAESALYMTII
jgi:hypothetical protein